MKRWTPWVVAVAVLAVVSAFAVRGMAERKAKAHSASAPAAQVVMEIAPDEVLVVSRQAMALGIPVSGAVRAVHSAAIKARVAGEVQGLALREGDAVRAGQEVARIDATEAQARLRQAQQQADAARAQAAINQRQFDNNQALVAQGFISKSALDTSQSGLDAARASHQAAVAAADVARKTLADTVLRSPINGFVSQRLVQNGERVGVEARILEVVDLAQLELEALVPAADAARVRVGQAAELALEGSAERVQARVARINPSAQAGSRAVPVYLVIDNTPPVPGLRQGVFLQGTVVAGTQDALAVPLDAVRTDQGQPYLQVVDQGRVAHRVVQTGARSQKDGAIWVAVEGVAEGTAVLAARVGALPVGTALRLPGEPASPRPPAPASAPAAQGQAASAPQAS